MSWILDLSYLTFILLEDFYLPPQQAAGMNVLFIIVKNDFFFFYSSWTTCTIIFFAPVLGCMIILGVFFYFYLKLIFLWVSPDVMIGLRFTSVPQFCFKSVLGFVKKKIKTLLFKKKNVQF